jgi:hypothetical protein
VLIAFKKLYHMLIILRKTFRFLRNLLKKGTDFMSFLSTAILKAHNGGVKKTIALGLCGWGMQNATAKAVLWETQADRLQMVSAALLDGMPVLSPAQKAGLSLRVFADTSFLPKTNPKIGAKSEKVPSSPVHAVPSLEAAGHFKLGNFGLGAKIYGGYLPGLPQAVTQLKAKINQSSYGGFLEGSYLIWAPWEVFGALGGHWTKANAKGPIASKEGDDVFDVKTQIAMFGGGIVNQSWGIYTSYMAALRKSRSEFKIVEDVTDLTLDDNMKDAKVPFASQFSVGWVPNQLPYSVSLSFLYVPSRLFMPRLSLSYAFFQADLQAGESSSAEAVQANKNTHSNVNSGTTNYPAAKEVKEIKEPKEEAIAPSNEPAAVSSQPASKAKTKREKVK